jgi:hypothetical protein
MSYVGETSPKTEVSTNALETFGDGRTFVAASGTGWGSFYLKQDVDTSHCVVLSRRVDRGLVVEQIVDSLAYTEERRKAQLAAQTAAADEKAHQMRDTMQRTEVEGSQYVKTYNIDWTLTEKDDAMNDSKIDEARSIQSSDDGSVRVELLASCNISKKKFGLTAAFFDKAGRPARLLDASAVSNGNGKPLARVTGIIRRGDEKPYTGAFLMTDFSNQINLANLIGNIFTGAASIDTPCVQSPAETELLFGFVGTTLPGPTCLLMSPRVLYQLRTSAGEVVIKVTPYSDNLHTVLEQCVATDQQPAR